MVCHWAIAHEELKDVLAQDEEISGEFVDRLYADQNKNLGVATGRGVATVAVKPVTRVNISDVGVSSEDAVSVLRYIVGLKGLSSRPWSGTQYGLKLFLKCFNEIEKPHSLSLTVCLIRTTLKTWSSIEVGEGHLAPRIRRCPLNPRRGKVVGKSASPEKRRRRRRRGRGSH